jgi:hypothetical protein
MRTRTTIAGTLAAGLLLVSCGGARDVAPAVEVEEPVDDGSDATDGMDATDGTDATDGGAGEDLDEDEALSAPADDTSDAPVREPDAASLDDPCADHQGREADAFIELVAPVDEQVASGEVELVGCSNVYEATVAWTLLDGDGRTLDEGFTTAECGTGCVGEFRDSVSLETAADEPVAYLQVFSPNASDEGPRQLQLTEVILVIG